MFRRSPQFALISFVFPLLLSQCATWKEKCPYCRSKEAYQMLKAVTGDEYPLGR